MIKKCKICFNDNTNLTIYEVDPEGLTDHETYLNKWGFTHILRYYKKDLFNLKKYAVINKSEDVILEEDYLELDYIEKDYKCNNIKEYLTVFNLFDIDTDKLFNFNNYEPIGKYKTIKLNKQLKKIKPLEKDNIENIFIYNNKIDLIY